MSSAPCSCFSRCRRRARLVDSACFAPTPQRGTWQPTATPTKTTPPEASPKRAPATKASVESKLTVVQLLAKMDKALPGWKKYVEDRTAGKARDERRSAKEYATFEAGYAELRGREVSSSPTPASRSPSSALSSSASERGPPGRRFSFAGALKEEASRSSVAGVTEAPHERSSLEERVRRLEVLAALVIAYFVLGGIVALALAASSMGIFGPVILVGALALLVALIAWEIRGFFRRYASR